MPAPTHADPRPPGRPRGAWRSIAIGLVLAAVALLAAREGLSRYRPPATVWMATPGIASQPFSLLGGEPTDTPGAGPLHAFQATGGSGLVDSVAISEGRERAALTLAAMEGIVATSARMLRVPARVFRYETTGTVRTLDGVAWVEYRLVFVEPARR